MRPNRRLYEERKGERLMHDSYVGDFELKVKRSSEEWEHLITLGQKTLTSQISFTTNLTSKGDQNNHFCLRN